MQDGFCRFDWHNYADLNLKIVLIVVLHLFSVCNELRRKKIIVADRNCKSNLKGEKQMHKQIEKYVGKLNERLTSLSPAQRSEEVEEIRQHLETLVARQLELGKSEEEATAIAIRQFGRAGQVGREISSAHEKHFVVQVLRRTGWHWLINFVVSCGLLALIAGPDEFSWPAKLLLAATFASVGASLGYLVRRKNRAAT